MRGVLPGPARERDWTAGVRPAAVVTTAVTTYADKGAWRRELGAYSAERTKRRVIFPFA